MNTTTQLSQQKVTFRTKINYCILFENLARKTTNTEAQTIRTTDAYGTKIAYMDGKSIRSKDKYGNKLFYLDGNTIKQKDNYGEKCVTLTVKQFVLKMLMVKNSIFLKEFQKNGALFV